MLKIKGQMLAPSEAEGGVTGSNVLLSGAFIIAFFSILSKLLGILRERLLVTKFGFSNITDAYLASFRIPDFIFNTLVLGALSAAFVPVFISYLEKNNHKKTEENAAVIPEETSEDSLSSFNIGFLAGIQSLVRRVTKVRLLEEHWMVANSILNILAVFFGLLAFIFFFLAPKIVPMITPGFDLETKKLAITFTRIMIFSPVLFAISNVFGGILQSSKKFFLFALAPSLYNVGIILGIVVLVPLIGVLGLPFGVLLGALLHLLIQFEGVKSLGFKWKAVLSIKHSGVNQVFRLIVPRTLGLAVNQINQVINTLLASALPIGSITAFYLADNLQSLPVSIIGVSLAVASFPILSQKITLGETNEFKKELSKSLRAVLFFVIPLSLFIILLRAQIIRVVYGASAVSWSETILTLRVLFYLAISLFAQSAIPLLARAFYANHNTKTPTIISTISVALNIILSLAFIKILGLVGLAISFSISAIFQAIALWSILRIKLGDLDDLRLIKSTFKITVSSLLSGGVLYIMLYLLAPIVGTTTFLGVFFQGLFAGLCGIVTYIFVSSFIKCEEMAFIKNILNRICRK